MSRKVKVTSVCVPEDIFQMGKEEGYNFSQLLTRAIIEKSDPRKELVFIRAEIREYERKIRQLEEEASVMEKLLEKKREKMLEDALVEYMPMYQRVGTIVDRVMVRLVDNLGMPAEEILMAFESRSMCV